jgi:hypothetical protein
MTKKAMTDEEIIKYVKIFSTVKEFRTADSKMYARCKRRGLLPVITKNMVRERTCHSDNDLLVTAKKCKSRSEFLKKYPKQYTACARRGLLDKAFDGVKKLWEEKWDSHTIALAAKKCDRRIDFYNTFPAAANKAKQLGILDKVCSHMTPEFCWDIDSVMKVAINCKTISEFKHKNRGAYAWVKNNDDDNIVFANMEKTRHSCNNMVYFWLSDMRFNGLPIYKIGITSERLGDRRIKEVAMQAGIKAEIIQLTKVSVKATIVEKELKKIGTNPKLEKFDGSTEFRAMNDEEFKQAVKTILKYAA